MVVNHISLPSAFNSVPAFTYFKSSENVTNFYYVIPISLHHFRYIKDILFLFKYRVSAILGAVQKSYHSTEGEGVATSVRKAFSI